MDDKLQELIRQLQRESCPPEVMDRVAERIAREQDTPHPLRQVWAWGTAVLALLLALGAWQRQADRHAQKRVAELEARVRANRGRVAEQTAGALGYIGQVLLEVAAQSQDSILKEAVPPLREGLETTKNKIKNI
jgi:hypothetical protein